MPLKPLIKKQEPQEKVLVQSGKEIAIKNEMATLKAIHLFGHLRRTEIATAVWPHNPKSSAYLMACKTVARLLEKKEILERDNALGQTSLVLATKGVRRLAEIDIFASTGFDLSCRGGGFYHRLFGTCYLIDRASSEICQVFGEYAIQKDRAPLTLEFAMDQFKKYPDGLVVYSGKEHGLRDGYYLADWLEVEAAYKAYDEVAKAFSILTRRQELNKSGTVLLNHLLFLVDGASNHAHRLAGYLKKYLDENPGLNSAVFLENIYVIMADISLPLNWKGSKTVSIKDIKTRNGFDLKKFLKEY